MRFKAWNHIYIASRIFVRWWCVILFNDCLDRSTQSKCVFVLCSAAIPLLVLSRSPSNIHHTHASSTQRAICGKTSYSSLPPGLCHQRRLAWPLWHQHCHNYGVLNHQYDISQSRHAKCQAGPLGLPLLLSERREKWRFVYCWIIIAIGIYEAHQAFRWRGCGVWRWLRGASHQTADTVEQDSQTTCLLSASLLNHHHSSHLYDHSHDISPVRAGAYAPPSTADSDNESGSRPRTFDASASCY